MRTDFLKALGKDKPTKDDFDTISGMSDHSLLTALVPKLRQKGMSMQAIANRYSVSKRSIQNICEKTKCNM